jgi:hypothetical protein
MNEEGESDSKGAKASGADAPVKASEATGGVEDSKPATQQQLAEVKHDLSAFEKATLRWTRTTTGIGFVTAVFICLQWCEMHSGSVDTHALAGAAGKQATAAQNFSDTAKEISNSVAGAVDQLKSAADNARTSIKATQEALRLEQRPWVYISVMYLTKPVVGQRFLVELGLKNEGRTPATPTGGANFVVVSPIQIPRLVDGFLGLPRKEGIIFPGIVYGPEQAFSAESVIVGEKEIAALNAKPPLLRIYVYGRIEYLDVWKGKHTTSFCAESKGVTGFEGCPEGTYPTYAN